ncbi:MAG: wax ester/triacylglycerol synthase family O-acyltransferase [Dehalococcoidia bacterium]
MPNNLARRLSTSDAAFLYLERPNAPLHIGSLGIYQGRLPYENVASHIEERLPAIPRYRQRLAFVPFNLLHPTWEDDPKFDIRKHVIRVSPPSPLTDEQLTELSTELFEKPLDRAKPLWEMYVIDNVEGDRSAIVSKVHHCLVDGVSGIELLMATLDISPECAPPPEATAWEPSSLPNPAARLADAFWDQLAQQTRLLEEWQETFIDPIARLRRTQDLLRSLSLASPWLLLPAPRTPFSKWLGSKRRAAFSEMSFVEIREIRTTLGGTVNDVVLAILAGALGRYLASHDHKVDGLELRVAVPVNVRMEEEQGALGNRVSCMLITLPMGERDPVQRLNTIKERQTQLKESNQAGGLEQLMRMASNVPAPIQALAAASPTLNTAVNLICTNVPGPMIPLYCVGHLMLGHYPMVPLSMNMGLGVGVTSYNQRLYFGLMVDPDAVPDVDRLKFFLDESALELRNAAGVTTTDLPTLGGNGSGQNGAVGVEKIATRD